MSSPDIESEQRLLFRLSFIPAILAAVAAYAFASQFTDALKEFGADLPWPSALYIRYPVLNLLPFAFVAAWFAWPSRRTRGIAALIVCSALSLGLFLFALWSCYGPIFALAKQA